MASDTEGYVFFWGSDGGLRRILRAHSQPATDFAFSPDRKYLVTTSWGKEIIVWNFTASEKVASLTTESRPVALAFNAAGDTLFFANRDGLYKVSLKNFSKPEKFFDAPLTCADADGNNFIVAGSHNLFRLFRLSDGKFLASATTCDSLLKIELKGNLIFTACGNGIIQLFEFSGTRLTETASGKYTPASSAEAIITADKKVLMANEITAVIWNPASGRFFLADNMPDRITALGYGKDSDFLAGSNDGKVTLCKAAEGAEIPSKIQMTVKKETSAPSGMTERDVKVELASGGIPVTINGRPVQAQQSVEVSSSLLDIYVWDDEYEDGDTIALFLNGEWLLQDYRITAEKKKLSIRLDPSRVNYLVLYAMNLGRLPPNTAVVSFHDGKSERRLTLASDLKRCEAVSFIMKNN